MVKTRSGMHYQIQTPPVRRNSISKTKSSSFFKNLAVFTAYTAIGCYFTRSMWMTYAQTYLTII